MLQKIQKQPDDRVLWKRTESYISFVRCECTYALFSKLLSPRDPSEFYVTLLEAILNKDFELSAHRSPYIMSLGFGKEIKVVNLWKPVSVSSDLSHALTAEQF